MHYTGEKLEFGNELVQTIAAEIGDAELKKLKMNAPAFRFLKNYKPASTVDPIKEQNEILAKGISSDGFIYSSSLPVNFESTYILRSIAYLFDNERLFDIFHRSDLAYDGRGVDITVAFRIVGREPDGSLILLWKELKLDLLRRKLKEIS